MILLGEPADNERLTLSLAEADRYMRGFPGGEAPRLKDLTDGLNLIKTDLLWGFDLGGYQAAVETWDLPDNSDIIRGAKQHDPPIWVVISPGGPADAFTQTMRTSRGQVIVLTEALLWLADRFCSLLVTTGSPEVIGEFAPGAQVLSVAEAQADFRAAVAAAESGTFAQLPTISLPDALLEPKARVFQAICVFMVAHELAHLFLGHQKFGQRYEFPREKFPNVHARHSEEYNADWLAASMVVDAKSDPEIRELAIWGIIMVFELLSHIEEYRNTQAESHSRTRRKRASHATHPHPVLRQTQAITYVQQDAFDGEWNVGQCDYLAASLMDITGKFFGDSDEQAMDRLVEMSDVEMRKRIIGIYDNRTKIASGLTAMNLEALDALIDESPQRAIVTVASAAAIYIGYIRVDCWVISGVAQLTLGYLYARFRKRYVESPTVIADIAEFDKTINAGIPHVSKLVLLLERGLYGTISMD